MVEGLEHTNAYENVDKFLRNNLNDCDYAEYSEFLEIIRSSESLESIILQTTINDLKEELKKSKQQLYKMVYALGSALDGQQHHEIHELGLTYADSELVWGSLSEARMVLRENNWINPMEYNLKEHP